MKISVTAALATLLSIFLFSPSAQAATTTMRIACGVNQIVVNQECKDCPSGQIPDPTLTKCVAAPKKCAPGDIYIPQTNSCYSPARPSVCGTGNEADAIYRGGGCVCPTDLQWNYGKKMCDHYCPPGKNYDTIAKVCK